MSSTQHASKAYVDAKSASVASAAVASHAGDSTAHVTSGEKSAWGAKYDKPSGGIPYSDLSSAVKAVLDAASADSAKVPQEASASNQLADKAHVAALISALRGDYADLTVKEIAAIEVAKIVAGASDSYDTLKEIADWILNDTTGAAKMANDIAALKSGKADAADLKPVATSGSYDDLSDKPTIPAVDATLATQGAAADAKAVGDALRSGFTEWVCEPPTYNGRDVEVKLFISPLFVGFWRLQYVSDGEVIASIPQDTDDILLELDFEDVGVTATRHLITPTKTSQLTNDGDGTNAFVKTNDARLTDARTPTAHHATHAANGSDPLAPADIGAAAATDLPYRLVEPGEWAFSDGQSHEIGSPEEVFEYGWAYAVESLGYSQNFSTEADALAALSLTFDGSDIIATRASLPGHLLDRAGNLVEVLGDTTLTLPALEHAGRLRDFLVRLEISGSTVPTITFAAPTGETITYETDGDEFPVPDEAGTWSYSFTESCVAHKFAVSLKKVNEFAAPQAQGGA